MYTGLPFEVKFVNPYRPFKGALPWWPEMTADAHIGQARVLQSWVKAPKDSVKEFVVVTN